MTVITLTLVPISLRGDLTKWLIELSTGVYIGAISARVRDELWDRICENCKDGQVTMVYSAKNEQKLSFRVHNSNWTLVDFEGLKLMKRPATSLISDDNIKYGYSKASKFRQISKTKKKQSLAKEEKSHSAGTYVVIDIETTGISSASDEIIEIGALKIDDYCIVGEYSSLIKSSRKLPSHIKELTGITEQMLQEAVPLEEALEKFIDFIGHSTIVGHNISFDLDFLQEGLKECGLPTLINKYRDTLSLSRRFLPDCPDFKLKTLINHLNLDVKITHRSMQDCNAVHQLYLKLMKIQE